MNPKVDLYFLDGCGRCPLGGTPNCKVHKWQEILQHLRFLLLESELTEELKWGVPCYTYNSNNVILLGAFNDNCVLSFLKGALLDNKHNLLQKPGENTQAGRVIRFTNADDIVTHSSEIKYYIKQAIEVEKAGLQVERNQTPEPIPDELSEAFIQNPDLEKAFFALTPGKQRGYIIHFAAPKQSKTRSSRIEKYTPQILDGIGFHDKYKMRK